MGAGQAIFLLAFSLFWASVLGNPVENQSNETDIEGDFIEDILGKWLRNFGTYTFMVDQDTDDEGNETVNTELTSPFSGETEEEDVDDYEQGPSAPISLSVENVNGLLNPALDYIVKLESLVAEGGSLLVTLASFNNKTTCGVGGFTLNAEDRERGGQEGRLNISHQLEGNRTTTFVAFTVENEAEIHPSRNSSNEGSSWEELSQNRWYAMGKLEGGELLTLTFTPPECECVMLKAYYAMPVGDNLILVVGPEAYPLDLEILLCVDPALTDVQENLIETEEEHEEEALQQEIEEPTNVQEEESNLGLEVVAGKIARGRGNGTASHAARKARRRARRRQEVRKAIRQAGKKVTRKRVQKQMRLQRRDDEAEDSVENRNGRQGGKWARKQARRAAKKEAKQARKAWKKQRKNRRAKHRRRNSLNRPQNATEEAAESFEDNLNTVPMSDEDAAADLLLNEGAEGEGEESETEDAVTHEGDPPNRRRSQFHGRRRGKAKNKLLKKEQRKGVKFCCKRGIKFKKSQFNNSTVTGTSTVILCNNADGIVISYAEHQFGINKETCVTRFETCCSKFSPQVWETVKARKAARKAKRKQQRKNRQQNRRQQRQHSTSTTSPVIE